MAGIKAEGHFLSPAYIKNLALLCEKERHCKGLSLRHASFAGHSTAQAAAPGSFKGYQN